MPLQAGQVFALYVAMYTFGRILFESMRIDDATRIFGVRFNLLLSIVLCVFGTVWFVWLGPPTATPEPTRDATGRQGRSRDRRARGRFRNGHPEPLR